MNPDYFYWQSKLDGGDPDPPEDRTQMPCGFWRLRDNQPLATWRTEGGDLAALRGFRGSERILSRLQTEMTAEAGSFGQAVSEESYREAFERGYWHDDPPLIETPGIGHNLPPDGDPFLAIRLELAGEAELAEGFLKKEITEQSDADRASTWARRVGLLSKRADELREAEKAPSLAISRAVDDKWRDVIETARALTARLKKAVEPFLLRLAREAAERARRDREEADRIRREAEQKDEVERAEAIRKAQTLERQAEPRNASAGRPSMRVSLRTVWFATIVDYDKAYAALKTHPDMHAFVQTLADRACRAKMPLDGVEFRTEERAT